MKLNFSSYSGQILEAGCDEAGRGCLAGPVVAAAVILKPGAFILNLNDSKKLTPAQRARLIPEILSNALSYGIGSASPAEIDRLNILNASILAMHRALDQLTPSPETLIIDGNKFKPWKMKSFNCIVKGDEKWGSIAAASVLAKNKRDSIMSDLGNMFPEFQWNRNFGYPTKKHKEALSNYGKTIWHRDSYGPVKKINFAYSGITV